MKPGDLFAHGKYTLLRKLRSSGMAEIWLARQHGTEGFAKDVVIKRILPHLAEEEKLVTMFLDEARIAANLNHPNVVQIFDLGSDGIDYFIAMEFINGFDLEQIAEQLSERKLPFPFEYACRVIADTCLGLAYAHDCKSSDGEPLKVVHRDVSPQNVLVSESGVVKLIDFGIAKAQTSSTRTQHGHTKGKICYMSPEQMMARPLDRRSDIFSAGVVFYELVCGQKPFEGENLLACFHQLMKQGIIPPSVHRPDIPKELENIIMKALERDREERYPTAAALRSDIERFLIVDGYTVGPEHLADFLRWLFADPEGTQFAMNLSTTFKIGQSPKASPKEAPPRKVTPSRPLDPASVKATFDDPLVKKLTGTHQAGKNLIDGVEFEEETVFDPIYDDEKTNAEPPRLKSPAGEPDFTMNRGFGQTGGFTNSSLAGLNISDDAPVSRRRRQKDSDGGSLLWVVLGLLFVGAGVAAYAMGLFDGKKDPRDPLKSQPTIRAVAVPDARAGSPAGKPDVSTRRVPPRKRPVIRKPAVVRRRPVKPRVRVAKVRKRPVRRRPKPRRRVRRRSRYGYLFIDTSRRAKVLLQGNYVDVPMSNRRRLRTGVYRLRFIWDNGSKVVKVRVRSGRITNKYIKLK